MIKKVTLTLFLHKYFRRLQQVILGHRTITYNPNKTIIKQKTNEKTYSFFSNYIAINA